MLPILPVLLLLLFQGPANIERLALEGRLPAALEAIQRMEQPRTQAESEAIASLLATSTDPQLTQALFKILNWVEEPPATQTAPVEPAKEEPPPDPGSPADPQQGFDECRRSRDGPLPG